MFIVQFFVSLNLNFKKILFKKLNVIVPNKKNEA